jgi:hypothetical protein
VRKACRSVVRSVSLETHNVNVDAIIGLIGSDTSSARRRCQQNFSMFHFQYLQRILMASMCDVQAAVIA